MKLLFKQRMFSWFDSYDIYDENQTKIYSVRGKLAWGHKLELYDNNNQHIATLIQKVISFLPKFEIYINDQYIGEIVKEFTFFKPSFTINCSGWQVKGNYFEWDYQINDTFGTIATIQKQLFKLTDTYIIDVNKDSDNLLALMVVLAIDAIKCTK